MNPSTPENAVVFTSDQNMMTPAKTEILMTLSPAILSAIDAAVKAVSDGTNAPEEIKAGYIAEAEQALTAGVPESQIISQFTQIANQQN